MSQPTLGPTINQVTANAFAAKAVIGHHAQLATGLDQRVEALVQELDSQYLLKAEVARQDLLTYLEREILPHARAEEQALYPPAAAVADGRLLVEGMIEEHHALTALVAELADARSLVRAAAAARALAALFAVHLAKENNLVLPLLVATPEVSLRQLLAGMHELIGADIRSNAGAAANTSNASNAGAAANASTAGNADAADEGCGCGGCGCGGDQPAGPAAAPVLSVDARLDVRDVPHSQRHALVLSTVAALPPGEAVVLVASHAPRPVLAEIDDRFGGQVQAQWLQSGPEVWQVRLERATAPV
jgi:uncharacterized protein (DUF2249 family)